jgi:hypothetical protein
MLEERSRTLPEPLISEYTTRAQPARRTRRLAPTQAGKPPKPMFTPLVPRLGEFVERHTPAIGSARLAGVQDGLGALRVDVSASAKRFVFHPFFAPEN